MKRALNALWEDSILRVHITNLPGFSLVTLQLLDPPSVCLHAM